MIFKFQSEKDIIQKPIKFPRSNYYLTNNEDDYYDQLCFLYDNSSLHQSILNNRIDKIYGTGLQITSGDKLFDDIFYKILYDYCIYGGFALEILWNRLHTKIISLNYLDFTKIRSGFIEEETDKVELYYYCNNFKNRNTEREVIQSFNENPSTDNRQIYYYKQRAQIYPKPTYAGLLKILQTDINLDNYYSNLVKNNFTSNTILSLPYEEPEDEEEKIIFEKSITDGFTGTDNAGSIAFLYGVKEIHPQILKFGENAQDNQYQWLVENIINKIISGHRLPNPLLCGVATPGSLGGNGSELQIAEIIYNKSVIIPQRNEILKQINYLNTFLLNQLSYNIESITYFDSITTSIK